MIKKAVLIGLLLASCGFAQSNAGPIPLPPDIDQAITATVDFEGSITSGVTDLVTSVAPSIAPVGWVLIGVFGVFQLARVVTDHMLRQISSHHHHPMALAVGVVAVFF